jgi:DNA-directed RNA polymerase I, II, and III subunit RPABC2
MSDYDSDSDRDSDRKSNDSISVENTVQNKKLLFKPSKPYKADETEDEDELDDAEDENLQEEDEEDENINKILSGPEERSDDENAGNISEDEDISDDEEEDEEGMKYDEDGDPIQNVPTKSSKPKKTQVIVDNDDDDDDDYDDNYLQKFDNEISKNYIEEFHPECLNHNYDEVAKLSIVVKNSDGIIIDPLHKTVPYLTKYEKARILGQRAKQIETGSRPYVKVPENIVDGYIIAELELKEKKMPFIIRRPIPGGAFEYWNLKDLEIVQF